MSNPSGGSSENNAGSKNRTMLGFVLDFRTNAKKAFKDTTKFVVDFITGWGKSNQKIGKKLRGMNYQLQRSIRNVKEWARTMRDSGPTITDVIDQIGEKFGGVAGILADTLARPGALMAGAATVATRSGMAMESTMVSLRREVALTEEEWDKYREVILGVSESMHAPMTQVQGLAKAFGAANMDINKYPELMEAAISVNRLSGIETQDVGRQIIKMSQDLKMSASEIHDYFNKAYAAAQVSNRDLSTVFSSIDEITDLVSRYMPDQMAKGMDEVTKIFAASGELFDTKVMYNMMSGMLDVESSEFARIRVLAAKAGGSVASEFEQAVRNGDLSTAFAKMVQGAKAMNMDPAVMHQMSGALQQTFGLSAQDIRRLQQLDTTMLDTMKSVGDASVSSNKLLKDTKDLLTITERWHKVWADIERVLLPLGEVIVELLHPILSVLGTVATWLSKFTSSLGPLGKKVLAIGIAFLTWKMWLTPIITLMKIIGANILGSVFSMGKLAKATQATEVAAAGVGGRIAGWGKSLFRNNYLTKSILGNFGSMRTAFTALNGTGVGFGGTLKDIFKTSGSLLLRIGKIALPFMLAYAAVEGLDAAFKKAFNFSFLDKISKSLGVPRGIVAAILSYLLLSSNVLKLLSPLTKLFTAALGGSLRMAKGLWATLVGLPALMGKSKQQAGGLFNTMSSAMTSFPGKLKGGFKSFGAMAGRAGAAIARVAGPVAIVLGLVVLLDKVLKKVFGVGVVDGMIKAVMKLASVLGTILGPILEGISWVIEKSAEGWASIVDGFVWMFSNDQEWEAHKKQRRKNEKNETSLFDDVAGLFGGGEDKAASGQGDPEQVGAQPQFDLSPVTNAVTGETVSARESFGTDDIINAIFRSGETIADLLKKIAYDPIAGTQNGSVRHAPITERRSQ